MVPRRHTCENSVPLPGMGEMFTHAWLRAALARESSCMASIVEPRRFLVQTQKLHRRGRIVNLPDSVQAKYIAEEDTYATLYLFPRDVQPHPSDLLDDAIPFPPPIEPHIASCTIEIR